MVSDIQISTVFKSLFFWSVVRFCKPLTILSKFLMSLLLTVFTRCFCYFCCLVFLASSPSSLLGHFCWHHSCHYIHTVWKSDFLPLYWCPNATCKKWELVHKEVVVIISIIADIYYLPCIRQYSKQSLFHCSSEQPIDLLESLSPNLTGNWIRKV